jgi:cytochrome b561
MQFRNTPDSYGAATKTLHWVTAALIVTLLALGLYMTDAPAIQRLRLVPLHKSLGVTVLALVALRILWHLYSARPSLVAGMKRLDAIAARAMHYFFYFAMVAMPLSGWFMSSAAGRPVSVFGLITLPDFVEKNQDLAKTFGTIHEVLGYTLIVGVILHVAAALKHHFIDRDATLRRMLPFVKG